MHAHAFTQKDAYTQGCFHREMLLTKMRSYTQAFAHTDAFTLMCCCAQIPLRSGAFAQVCFYTGTFAHRGRVLLHSDASSQLCFYRGMLLHTCAFAKKSFDAVYPLHAKVFTRPNTFTQKGFLHRNPQRRLCTEILGKGALTW